MAKLVWLVFTTIDSRGNTFERFQGACDSNKAAQRLVDQLAPDHCAIGRAFIRTAKLHSYKEYDEKEATK